MLLLLLLPASVCGMLPCSFLSFLCSICMHGRGGRIYFT